MRGRKKEGRIGMAFGRRECETELMDTRVYLISSNIKDPK